MSEWIERNQTVHNADENIAHSSYLRSFEEEPSGLTSFAMLDILFPIFQITNSVRQSAGHGTHGKAFPQFLLFFQLVIFALVILFSNSFFDFPHHFALTH